MFAFFSAHVEPAHVVVVGIGPLGRLTGNEIDDSGAGRRVVGYLRFPHEPPHQRLHAPLLGTVDDLDSVLRASVVEEVYLASVDDEDVAYIQEAIDACEEFDVPFALPAYSYRLERAELAERTSFPDGYLHFTIPGHHHGTR